jgi:hypothetical protein
MDFGETLVVFCIFGLPVIAFMVTRFLRHAERLEMIRRGIIPPPEFDKRAYREWRRAGGAWPPPGAGPAPGPWTQQSGWTAPTTPTAPTGWGSPDYDPQRALYKGIQITAVGFAIVIGLSFIGGTPGSPEFRGGPWLLGGLIPMFVGIAQIIVAVLAGARLPGVGPTATFIPPPPGQHAPPPPGGYGGGSPSSAPPWAQQPGRPPFEELSKPITPPDLR